MDLLVLGRRAASYRLSTPITRFATVSRSAVGSAVSSIGAAVAACACCTVPLLLAALGAGAGVGSATAAVTAFRWPVAIVALIMVGISWLFLLRDLKRGGKKLDFRMGARVLALAAASGLSGAAALWESMDAQLMAVLY